MPRASYKKWRTHQDIGLRLVHTVPAWNPGDLVEVIGTGLRGEVVRCTTLDFTRWEVKLPTGKFLETHANNLRAAIDTRPHPEAGA
jgi:hypothetical protein